MAGKHKLNRRLAEGIIVLISILIFNLQIVFAADITLQNGALYLPNGMVTDGSVGIGTTDPGSYKLRVIGNTYSDNLCLSDGCKATWESVGGGSIGGGWTDSGATVKLTTISDKIVIGQDIASTAGALTIYGNEAPGTNSLVNEGLVLGQVTGASGYSWLQSYGQKPLVLNPLSNYVGIGTITPQAKMHIVSPNTQDNNYGDLTVENTGNTWSLNQFGTYSNTPVHSSQLILRRARGTITSPAAVSNGDQIGGIFMRGYDGFSYQQRAYITSFVNGPVNAGNVPIDLVFNTGSTSPIERMRIKSDGNVGIGTTVPVRRLEVSNDGSATQFRVTATSGTGYLDMEFRPPGTLSSSNLQWTVGRGYNTNRFEISDYDGTNDVERVVIDNSGNVGIGTTSPEGKLHIVSTDDATLVVDTRTDSTGWAKLKLIEQGNLATDYGALLKYGGGNIFQIGTVENDVETMVITIPRGSGNVGIGTTDPGTYKLKVAGSIYGDNLCLSDGCKATWASVGGGATGGGWTDSGATVKLTTVSDKIVIGQDTASTAGALTIYGNEAPGTNSLVNEGLVLGQVTGASGYSWLQSYGLKPLVLNPLSNYVGIGTNDPKAKLHMYGTIPQLKVDGPTEARVLLATAGADKLILNYQSGSGVIGTLPGAGDMSIRAGGADVITAKSGGNVGIKTKDPQTGLEIGDGSSNYNANAITINSGAPRLYLKTGATKYNWKVAAQDTVDNGFEILSGNMDGNPLDDTYTARFVIKGDTGNVGIGTTDPGTYKLKVAGDISGTKLCIADDCRSSWPSGGGGVGGGWTESGNAVYLTNLNNGKVGIGTGVGPEAKLHVYNTFTKSSDADADFKLENSQHTFTQAIIETDSNTAADSSILTLKRSRAEDGLNPTGAPLADGDTIGTILFRGRAPGSFIQSAAIKGIVSGAPTSTSLPVDLVFYAGTNGLTPERMRIKSNGNVIMQSNVGIGANPVAKLEVDGSIYFKGGSGDVSGEGIVGAFDAALITRYLEGLPPDPNKPNVKTFTPEQMRNADVDGDNQITYKDASIIMLESLGNTREEAKRQKNKEMMLGIGTGNTIPLWTGATTLGNSIITQDGTKIVVGGGSGKIDAGTVDPIYTIGGKQYATYLPAMTGVKEETTGTIKLINKDKENNYYYEIDFNNLEEGSDLWLFEEVTDLKNNFDRMTILLTPSFNGKVWYNKNIENKKLTIFAQTEMQNDLEVSYRLTAPRFDYNKWSNYADSENEGFNLDKEK